jgi:hypothetical protein
VLRIRGKRSGDESLIIIRGQHYRAACEGGGGLVIFSTDKTQFLGCVHCLVFPKINIDFQEVYLFFPQLTTVGRQKPFWHGVLLLLYGLLSSRHVIMYVIVARCMMYMVWYAWIYTLNMGSVCILYIFPATVLISQNSVSIFRAVENWNLIVKLF